MSNLLARIRFSQTNKSTHSICIACVFDAHRSPEKPQQLASFNKAMCAVRTSLIIQTHKTMTSPTESL